MTLGFIIIRHVNNKITDLYWKECYTCIRKFYDSPILIIDDSSDKEFLNENIYLKNCTVIYDKLFKGAAELLPYYYFYKLKPFDTAVILHDSVFIQSKVNFELNENKSIRFLWTFQHQFDNEIFHLINDLFKDLPDYESLLALYHNKSNWLGCFGVMSVIKWEFVEQLEKNHNIFSILISKIKKRENRHGLERAFAVLAYYNTILGDSLFGDIHSYMTWGLSFTEYMMKNYSNYPIIKVWTAR